MVKHEDSTLTYLSCSQVSVGFAHRFDFRFPFESWKCISWNCRGARVVGPHPLRMDCQQWHHHFFLQFQPEIRPDAKEAFCGEVFGLRRDAGNSEFAKIRGCYCCLIVVAVACSTKDLWNMWWRCTSAGVVKWFEPKRAELGRGFGMRKFTKWGRLGEGKLCSFFFNVRG